MAISGTDSYGPYVDTGVGVAPVLRPSVEVEVHFATEIDTGSKIAVTSVATTHQPHRSATSPR